MSSVECEDGLSDHRDLEGSPQSISLAQLSPFRRTRSKVESWFEGTDQPCAVPVADYADYAASEVEYWIDEVLNVYAIPKRNPDMGPSLDNLHGPSMSSDADPSVGEVEACSTGAHCQEDLAIQSPHCTAKCDNDAAIEAIADHAQTQVPVDSLLTNTCIVTFTLLVLSPRQFLDTILLLLLFAPYPHFARNLRYWLLVAIVGPDLKAKLECVEVFGCLVFMESLVCMTERE